MSRIGKLPIEIPEKIEVKIDSDKITVKGLKGELSQDIHPSIKVEKKDNVIMVSVASPCKDSNALWGLYRNLIFNMVKGMSHGFEKKLEINGVGYRVALEKDKLILNVGYSHPVEFVLPKEVEAKVEKNTVVLSSFDKQLVGQVAANIRKIRKPEPYKGKGIKYDDEVIRRKAGKAAKGGEK
ncbi:50S ribosomal protein L6 [Candidatus Falkowbacteria bacterium RBG_13_39_14]|uniref:Large ribosomal subunit protein uL6 n=1 Tax=Candidatus Falkowbacteria bacterium RBG_13_39_14 TaxID=1797985 RepID=A0A1F5S3H2_9BACT|nr:MAG: 50S ribosomal protein L6 [Candidatus Falkowbacteria bacterium RBG_13_39_14]